MIERINKIENLPSELFDRFIPRSMICCVCCWFWRASKWGTYNWYNVWAAIVDGWCLRKSIGWFSEKFCGNVGGNGGFGGNILIKVRICVLFNEIFDRDGESNWWHILFGFPMNTGDIYKFI